MRRTRIADSSALTRFAQSAIVLCAAGLLSACGGSDKAPAAGGSAPAASSSAPRTGAASAEEVAEESRGDVDCPADIDTPARAEGAPVDDVVGVRPGLTYDEAANVVKCSNELMVITEGGTGGFNIQTYGQTLRQGFTARLAEERVEKTSKQIMEEMQDDMMARSGNAVRYDLQPGQSKWLVTTMGMPGQEKVVAAAREEWFADGKQPTIASVGDALLKKYGKPTFDKDNAAEGGQRWIRWIYDPFGRPVLSETSPLYNSCTGTSINGGVNLSPDCGLVVEAHVIPMPDNRAMARSMDVGVVDQAAGYESVTAVEQNLEQAEQAKRAQQVQDASKNAEAPTL